VAQDEETKTTAAADLAGRPLKLAELVDYQTGAVVSRTLVDKKAGYGDPLRLRRGAGA